MRRLLIILCFFSVSAGLFAQALNLEQARVLGLANSRSLARYELSIRSSILDEKNQLYSMLPSVSAGYSASMNYLKDWELLNPVDTFSAGATFSITQIIFQGGKSFIQKAISAIATESVRIDALAEYFNVIDSTDNAYYAVLEAAATLEAEESSLQAAKLALSIAQIRQESGMINQGDYLKALSDMESRENSYNQARRNLALSTAKLKTLTGISGTIELEPVDFSAYEDVLAYLAGISDEDADGLYEDFWKKVTASNPAFAKSSLNSQRAEKNYTLTIRDYAPTITATIFGTGLNYSTANGFGTTSTGGVSIRGTIPVDFWLLNNKLEKSKIALDNAAHDYKNTELSLETDLQTALLNTFAQAGSVLSARRSLEYTEKHFEFVMERYRLLQSSVSDLGDASTLFINSRNSHIRNSYSFLRSLSKLRSLTALDDEAKLIEMLYNS
ncbi:MAG: TolC family protein [Treponema sp.]|jgi:outer membrane protein TolC|nr:TolC family protein [Treponema sp.]